ncbi:MAG: DUF4097 family beta strand repeat-containing protein [Terriglobales bacterium]
MSREQWQTKLLICAGLTAAFLLTLQAAHAQDYRVRLPGQLIQQTYSLGSAPFVKVDGFIGGISIIGDGGSQVQLAATKIIRAQSQDLAQRAQREVHLDLSHTGDSLDVYVDGPFRHHYWHNPGYRVTFDITLHVPGNARVNLKTLDGGIRMANLDGGFRVATVNGRVEAQQLAGAGEAHTVNGAVRAGFTAAPSGNCTFATVNGSVHVTFPPGLNAVLHYQTVNGGVYTDFKTAPMASPAPESVEGGMRVFRPRSAGTAQVGRGGPVITLKTVNGGIYIHRGR